MYVVGNTVIDALFTGIDVIKNSSENLFLDQYSDIDFSKKKHWEDELQETLRGMSAPIPPVDLRTRVMREVHRSVPQSQAAVRPLLSASVRKAIYITLPLLMIIALMFTKGEPSTGGTLFGLKPIMLPDLSIPDFTNRLSATLKQAFLAISVFAFVQVILIGRLMRKTDQHLH